MSESAILNPGNAGIGELLKADAIQVGEDQHYTQDN